MTNETKHTPGPWDYKFYVGTQVRNNHMEDVDKWDILAPDGTAILSAHGPSHRRKANARLIAAAPDLLEALSGLVESFDIPAGPSAVMVAEFRKSAVRNARAAIAKATGRAA